MTTHDEQTNTTTSAAADQPQPAPMGVADEQSETRTELHTENSTDGSLFADNDRSSLHSRWDDVQAGFVDDPKDCVQKADALVAEVVQQLTAGFADARARLESQWARGEDASTEDLRQALKRYREFFERLLAV
jgi:hypothetical protein